MELGNAPVLLQPRRLGRMEKPLSPADSLVPSASGSVYQSPRLSRQLALSPSALSASGSGTPSTKSPALGTKQPARTQTSRRWSSASAATETRHTHPSNRQAVPETTRFNKAASQAADGKTKPTGSGEAKPSRYKSASGQWHQTTGNKSADSSAEADNRGPGATENETDSASCHNSARLPAETRAKTCTIGRVSAAEADSFALKTGTKAATEISTEAATTTQELMGDTGDFDT
jgi:hypothetical protein